MVIDPIPILLKDGREAVLRSLIPEEAPALLECFMRCAEETYFLYVDPMDREKYSVDGERRFLEEYNGSDSGALIGCFVDGHLAGTCDITFQTDFKARHRGGVGIAIQRRFWGLGIGTAMFRAMIDISRAREGIAQLELDFIEGNARARALYEKMGFRVCAVLPDAVRLFDGRLLNEYRMILKL